MTDRIHGFFVSLDKDIRTDDFEDIKKAVLMLRHVLSVEPEVADYALHTATARVRQELGEKLFEVLHGRKQGSPQ